MGPTSYQMGKDMGLSFFVQLWAQQSVLPLQNKCSCTPVPMNEVTPHFLVLETAFSGLSYGL
jgi:hypothetical protein